MGGFPEYDVMIVRKDGRVLFELRNSAHELLGSGSLLKLWMEDMLYRGGRYNVMLETPPQEVAQVSMQLVCDGCGGRIETGVKYISIRFGAEVIHVHEAHRGLVIEFGENGASPQIRTGPDPRREEVP